MEVVILVAGACCPADGDFLLMPCLDFVPEHRDDMPLFFTKAQTMADIVPSINMMTDSQNCR